MRSIWLKIKPYLREFLRSLPKIKILYILCQKYIDDYKGENNSNMYTNGELTFLKRNVKKFNIVFDVGAGIGEYTKMALSLKNGLNIHCFEPSLFTYQKLISNNFPPNVICNNFGLSSSKREAKLFIFEDGSLLNSFYKREGLEDSCGLEPQKKEEIVKLDSLDNYCTQNNVEAIDFVKIDVEGHELEVLKGMKNLLKNKKVNLIQFEYGIIDSGVFLKDIFHFFKDYDYQIYQIFPKKIKYIERYDQRLDNFQYKNFLIVKRGYEVC